MLWLAHPSKFAEEVWHLIDVQNLTSLTRFRARKTVCVNDELDIVWLVRNIRGRYSMKHVL
jgi:hypothetical protein